MASSIDTCKLSLDEKAELVHHMLHGPTSKVKDLFRFMLGGAVGSPTLRFMSEEAWKMWKQCWPKDVYADGCRGTHHKDSILEHVVPTVVLSSWLLDNRQQLSLDDIKVVLARCPVAVITKDEDNKLRIAGLARRMPRDDFNCMSDDPFLRYRAANI